MNAMANDEWLSIRIQCAAWMSDWFYERGNFKMAREWSDELVRLIRLR